MALEDEYQNYLGVMFRNSSLIRLNSPAIHTTSKFIDKSNYYASAEILGNLNFIEKEMSNLKRQFDEIDLITYFTGPPDILLERDSKSAPSDSGFCHSLKKVDGQFEN